jgi:hypothetical protein
VTYGFEAPFAAACARTPGLAHAIDLRGRARSGLIAQDLLSVGWTPRDIASASTCVLGPLVAWERMLAPGLRSAG